MIDTLKQTLEELKGKRIKYYSVLNYPLDDARSNEPLFIAGAYIYVLILDGTAKIKLNEISGDDIDLLKYRQIASPFYRIFLTHSAQPGKVLSLAIGIGSEVFSLQDFQSPDIAQMAADIADLKKTQAYNYGTQIAKSNVSTGAIVVMHTVTSGKTLLLENWALSAWYAISHLYVRDLSDVTQYNLLSLFLDVNQSFSLSQRGTIYIPEGYDICLYGPNQAYAEIKGREI